MTSARKRPEESHENHERWLVSYADFITLMFAFFVVMFATSQSDKAKTKAVSDAVERALADEHFASKLKQVLGPSKAAKDRKSEAISLLTEKKAEQKPAEKLPELTPSLKKLTAELESDIKAGRVQISLEPRGLVISLKEGAFFEPGDDTVHKERYGSIAKLASVLKPLPNPVRLEGHTDSTPIRNSRFRSNWELSAARSISVLQLLRDRFEVPESRMAIVGYADTVAMDTNTTDAGRARNRRVDLTILNDVANSQEAKPSPSQAAK
jgi:chemotaxis protein MotB